MKQFAKSLQTVLATSCLSLLLVGCDQAGQAPAPETQPPATSEVEPVPSAPVEAKETVEAEVAVPAAPPEPVVAAPILPEPVVTDDEPVELTLYPHLTRSIGGVTRFRREQFITIHESPIADNWEYWQKELEISYGRDGGSRTSTRKRVPEDPKRPGYPDLTVLQKLGKQRRAKEAKAPHITPEISKEMVLCTHPEHYYARPDQDAAPWGPKHFEGAAEFTAHFMKEFWDDESRPRYLEVFNEPFVHRKDVGATIEGFCEQHVVVARRVKQLTPDVLVGGYTAAWVELEARNFAHWEGWQKKFMDLAGADMDFFSYHIYDGINVVGEARNRTGSNQEAIMDLIDQYSYILFDYAKPHLVSEYGMIPEGGMETVPYSAQRSAEMIRSTNGQLMSFMDHPDRMLKVIPFFLDKGLWTYGLKNEAVPGEANPFLLRRRLADGSFVETDLVDFYRYWKGINGNWLYHRSSDPDLRCHFLNDDRKLYVILSNLELEARTLNLKGLEDVRVQSVTKRSLRTDGDGPVLSETELPSIQTQMTLHGGESVILMIETQTFSQPVNKVLETRYYAVDYLKPIEANKPVQFSINKVRTGKGDARLRLSFGREHGTDRKPEVLLNNQPLEVPEDWAGDTQEGRTTFFGMLEIPVEMSQLRSSNTVTVTFPDSGGKVACAILQVNRVTR